MGLSYRRVRRRLVILVLVACSVLLAQSAPAQTAPASPQQKSSQGPASPSYCAACIRANLGYLAGPELHGRGSGTEDEHHAAQFIAHKLKQYGLLPAAEDGQYIQTATLRSRTVTKAPVLSFDPGDSANSSPANWTHGKEMVVFTLSESEVSGPLQKLDLNDETTSPAALKDGAVVLLKLKPDMTSGDVLAPYLQTKAAIVIVPELAGEREMFERRSQGLPRVAVKMDDEPGGPVRIVAKPDAVVQLWGAPEGAIINLHADMTPWVTSHTWNVLAKIVGTTRKRQIVLLSAHLDHLGVRNGKTYPGADDDASGTTAVMELARVLAKEKKPRRTIVVALWGSEEAGLLGARYFLKHPTFNLPDIVANLEFEMVGRSDSKLGRKQLWLTGWERTNLGPELAAHGAKLVADPHPDQGFFARSDNYALAKDGIIAQTVSSYGLHKDYHRPTDTLAKIDWQHLDTTIASMIAPVTWLVNGDFVPTWKEGMKP
jgi:aminopeptidase YwaD